MVHMDMPLGPDHPFAELDGARGADENAPRRACDLAAGPHGEIDPQRDPVGEGKLHLRSFPGRPEDAHRRQHFSLRADDHHGLIRGVEAVLIKVFVWRQRPPLAEQPLDMVVGEMAVPGGDTHHQLRFAPRLRLASDQGPGRFGGDLRRRGAAAAEDDLADDPLDSVAVEAGGDPWKSRGDHAWCSRDGLLRSSRRES